MTEVEQVAVQPAGQVDSVAWRHSLQLIQAQSIEAMADIANRDAAEQSLDIAKAALAANNLDKAQKFVEKAMKLYPSDEVRCL